jgi:lysophospholipase L1-like esterase
MTQRRLWLLRGASVALGCLAGFGIIEAVGAIGFHFIRHAAKPELPAAIEAQILSRGRSIETVPDPYLLYKLKPSLQTPNARTNQYGLRGPEIDELPGPNVYRILLLGGSVAWGYSARSDDETISEALERYLNAHRERSPALAGKTIEVLNGAVPGYVTWQEALAYSIHHRKLDPRLIVTLDGANDYYAAILSQQVGAPMRFRANAQSYLASKPTLSEAIGGWFRYRVHELKLAKYLRRLRRPSLAELAPPVAAEVVEDYRQALEHLADIAAIENAAVMPVLQPMLILPDAKPLTDFERQSIRYYDLQIPGINAAYDEVFEAIRKMFAQLDAERAEVFPFDATGVFSDETAITYVDHCHLTPRGRYLLAAAVGERILEILDQRGA